MSNRDECKIEPNSNAKEYLWRPIGTTNNPKYTRQLFGTLAGVNGLRLQVDKNWWNTEQCKIYYFAKVNYQT